MSTATQDAPVKRPDRAPIKPIPLGRVVSVELRKMFDTRSGFWLMASIVITSLIATIAVIVFAPDDEVKYSSFINAVGFPTAIILPIVAILSVTSEWSQRSGLTTFTLIPHRGRVVLAKFIATIIVAVVAMVVAFAVGAVGTIVGSAIAGVDTTWDVTFSDFLYIVLGNILGMLVGFMLGVLIRHSAGAIVAYFVFSLVLPGLFALLAANAQWFEKIQGWVDFNYAQTAVFEGHLTGEQWGQLGTTSVIWLVVPMIVGVWLVLRSEVK